MITLDYLQNVIDNVNTVHGTKLKLSNQKVITTNMSVQGYSGRLWFNPLKQTYHISLSGESLTKAMTPFMINLFGPITGNKQAYGQPYWSSSDLTKITLAVSFYASL